MCQLGVGSIRGLAVFVLRELGLVGFLMAKSQEKVFDVIFDEDPACPLGMFLCIVPLDVNSSKFSSCPIFCDLVVLFEDVVGVMDMPFCNVFNSKIVHY